MLERVRLKLYHQSIKRLGIRLIGGHFLYTPALSKSSKVIDAGANVGRFSRAISSSFQCQCVAIEPVPEYFNQIPENSLIQKFQAVLADEPGELDIVISSEKEASSIFSEIAMRSGRGINILKVKAFSVTSFLEELEWETADLLKMDIECAELQVLKSLTDKELLKLPQILVEFHDFVFPEQKPEIQQAIFRLEKLGFIMIRASRNHLMDMVFLNKNRIRFSSIWYLTYLFYTKLVFPNPIISKMEKSS